MRKIIVLLLSLAAALCCAVALSACGGFGGNGGGGKEPPEAVAIRIDGDSQIELTVGESTVLHAYTEPDGAYVEWIDWASENPEVATVDVSGRVVACSAGETQISVSTSNGLWACVIVNVKESTPDKMPDYAWEQGLENILNPDAFSLTQKTTEGELIVRTKVSFELNYQLTGDTENIYNPASYWDYESDSSVSVYEHYAKKQSESVWTRTYGNTEECEAMFTPIKNIVDEILQTLFESYDLFEFSEDKYVAEELNLDGGLVLKNVELTVDEQKTIWFRSLKCTLSSPSAPDTALELTDIDGEYLIELPQNYTVVLESITVPENFTAEVLKETYFPIVAFPYDADYELEVSCDDTGIAEVAKEDYVTVTGKAYGQAHITVTAGDFTKVCTVQVVPYKLSGYEWSKAMSDLVWEGNFTMFRTENGGEMYTIKSYNGLYDVKPTYGDEEKIYGFDAEYNDEGYSGYYCYSRKDEQSYWSRVPISSEDMPEPLADFHDIFSAIRNSVTFREDDTLGAKKGSYKIDDMWSDDFAYNIKNVSFEFFGTEVKSFKFDYTKSVGGDSVNVSINCISIDTDTVELPTFIPVQSISVSTTLHMEREATTQIRYTVSPKNATDKRVFWDEVFESEEPLGGGGGYYIAQVDQQGLVQSYQAAGSVKIVVKAIGGAQTEITVIVDPEREYVKGSDGLQYDTEYDRDTNRYYSKFTGVGDCTEEDITISNYFNGFPVTEVDCSSAGNDTVKHITLTPGITTIVSLRDFTSLETIPVSDDLKIIGWPGFYGCTGLTSVTIPSSVEIVKSSAFEYCSNLSSITIDGATKNISRYAFDDTAYANDPNNWTEDGVLYIDNYLITVDRSKFDAVQNYTVREGTVAVAAGAFNGCSKLETVDLGSSIKHLGVIDGDASMFYYCTNLREVIAPDDLDTSKIKFDQCPNFKGTLKNEKYYTFGNRLISIAPQTISAIIPENIVNIDAGVFDSIKNTVKYIYFPAACKNIAQEDITTIGNISNIKVYFEGDELWQAKSGETHVRHINKCTPDGWLWTTDNSGKRYTGYIGEGGEIVVPEDATDISYRSDMHFYEVMHQASKITFSSAKLTMDGVYLANLIAADGAEIVLEDTVEEFTISGLEYLFKSSLNPPQGIKFNIPNYTDYDIQLKYLDAYGTEKEPKQVSLDGVTTPEQLWEKIIEATEDGITKLCVTKKAA